MHEWMNDVPGARPCLGCRMATMRRADDGLCPRCAGDAEQLMEQIELDSIDRDLALLTEFEAYCHRREARRDRRIALKAVFGTGDSWLPTSIRRPPPWPDLAAG